MKKIAVQIDPFYDNSFSKKWIEEIDKINGYKANPIDIKKNLEALELVQHCEGVMWHYRHIPNEKYIAYTVLGTIENILKIPVWPNFDTRFSFDEKIVQSYILQASGVPTVKSWVFWTKEEAEDFFATTYDYPFVFKLSVGAGAANVFKINSQSEALLYVNRMFGNGMYPYTENEFQKVSMLGNNNFPETGKRIIDALKYVTKRGFCSPPWYYEIQKNYMYIQKFIPNNHYDIRVTIIGDRAFTFTRENRDNDFRASGSGNISYDMDRIPKEAIQKAFLLSEKNNFQSMGYDFLINENGSPLINEMSYGFSSKAVYDCPGYWDKQLKWHEGHMWPQKAQVIDFVNEVEKHYSS